MNRTHLRDSCAASSYTLTLLLQGYKFNHKTWHNIHFRQQVGKRPAATLPRSCFAKLARLCPPCSAPPGCGNRG